jgi:hypothetical protein
MTFAICIWTEDRKWVTTGATFDTYEHAVKHLVALQKLTRRHFAVIRKRDSNHWDILKHAA